MIFYFILLLSTITLHTLKFIDWAGRDLHVHFTLISIDLVLTEVLWHPWPQNFELDFGWGNNRRNKDNKKLHEQQTYKLPYVVWEWIV